MIEHLPGLEPKDRVMLSRLRFVMLVCGLLMLANLLLGFAVWRLVERVRTPVTVSCSYRPYPGENRELPLAVAFGEPGAVRYQPLIAPHLTASGVVRAEFSFRAAVREPGSRYSLRYRLEEGVWQEIPVEEVGPLQFTAVAELDSEQGDILRYQAVARLDGEVIASSQVQVADLAGLVGSPDLQYRAVSRRKGEVGFSLKQVPKPTIEAWQVVAVRVNAVYSDRTEPAVVEVEDQSLVCFLPTGDYLRLEVEAVYSDGLVVEGEIQGPFLNHQHQQHFHQYQTLLTRPRTTDQ